MGFSREDLEAFKQKASTSGGGQFFRLEEGRQLIRLFISPNETSKQPFYEIHTHWYTNMAGKRAFILCTEGIEDNHTPCPICAKIKELFASKNAALVDLAKDVCVRKTFAQWVFVLREGKTEFEQKPLVLNISRKAMNQILEEILADNEDNTEDSITAWDLKSGRVLYVKKKTETHFQTTYHVRTKDPFDLSKEPWVSIIKETPTVISQFRVPSADEQDEVVQAIEAEEKERTGTITGQSSLPHVEEEEEEVSPNYLGDEGDGEEGTETPEPDTPHKMAQDLASQAKKLAGLPEKGSPEKGGKAGHQVGRSLAEMMKDD